MILLGIIIYQFLDFSFASGLTANELNQANKIEINKIPEIKINKNNPSTIVKYISSNENGDYSIFDKDKVILLIINLVITLA